MVIIFPQQASGHYRTALMSVSNKGHRKVVTSVSRHITILVQVGIHINSYFIHLNYLFSLFPFLSSFCLLSSASMYIVLFLSLVFLSLPLFVLSFVSFFSSLPFPHSVLFLSLLLFALLYLFLSPFPYFHLFSFSIQLIHFLSFLFSFSRSLCFAVSVFLYLRQ